MWRLTRSSSGWVSALCCVVLVAVTAGVIARSATAAPRAGFRQSGGAIAVIYRTTGGIAHVRARTLYGIGYGQGYVEAQDNVCVLADGFTTFAARRSFYFGPDGSYVSPGNEQQFNNLDSDFAYQRVNDEGIIEKLLAEAPPNGPTEQARQAVAGFAAGYDRRLRDIGGAAGVRDPSCHMAPWVRPITAADVWRRVYSLTGLAGWQELTEPLVGAAPPGAKDILGLHAAAAFDTRRLWGLATGSGGLPIGSNGYAIGGDATANGMGMLIANPHFPWTGTERFEQFELVVPNRLDVSGAALLGVPGINIGHTSGVAWTHTTSTALTFTPYQLTLVPGDPTSYIVDGQVKHMHAQTVTVPMREMNGALATRKHNFYETEWGPVTALPDWTAVHAYALADANATNLRFESTLLAMDQAQNVGQLRAAEERYQGIPWVNTIAADRAGLAYYADQQVVPNVPNSLANRCLTPDGALDGSRIDCHWQRDADAVDPNIFGPSHLPRLTRRDFVGNSNDSYWLVNPYQLLEGYAGIIGDERTERSLRTRVAMRMMTARIAGTDGLPGRGFTLAQLQQITFEDVNYSGQLLRDQIVAACHQHPSALSSSGDTVDLTAACDVLAHWDLHATPQSRGEMLWSEFFNRAATMTLGIWGDSFDPNRPLDTPNKLNANNPAIWIALADAVQYIQSKGLLLDAPWADIQYVQRNGVRIPIDGCQGTALVFEQGCFNLQFDDPRPDGTYEPRHGTSFVMAVTWNRHGQPQARTILTYSQSSDPTSRWYDDQTKLFSNKQWITDQFAQGTHYHDLEDTPLKLTRQGPWP